MTLLRLLLLLSVISQLTWRATTDEGNGFDPHGTPKPLSASCDEGSGLDPHGGPCREHNALDAGVRIDPEG
jgi:hypothetical protein